MADRPEHELAREVRSQYRNDGSAADRWDKSISPEAIAWLDRKCVESKPAEPVAWLIHHHDGRETMTLFPSVVDALREHTQSISPLYFHPAPADGLREALRLVKNDAYAVTFQTMGEYRTALIGALSRLTGAEHD